MEMLQALAEVWHDFSARYATWLRDAALGLFAAVARLAYDRKNFDGINIQFFYELFRSFTVALTVVFILDAIAAAYCIVGPLAMAVALAAGFFAVEIVELAKSVINNLGLPLIKRLVLKK